MKTFFLSACSVVMVLALIVPPAIAQRKVPMPSPTYPQTKDPMRQPAPPPAKSEGQQAKDTVNKAVGKSPVKPYVGKSSKGTRTGGVQGTW